jgi:SLOG family YspA-like protein
VTRILVTGSQGWEDEQGIRYVLTAVYRLAPGAVLVSGACAHGADLLCERAWTGLGGQVERHRAVWRPDGVFDRAAGFRRSEDMVHLGAGICLAFILPCEKPACAGKPPDRKLPYHGTHGSVHCADYAEDHGISVRRFTPILPA